MFVREDEVPDAAAILKGLGQLALAASQAEHLAAQGLYVILTDEPGSDEGANRLMMSFRSFDALCRLLRVAMRCETPLNEILSAATAVAREETPHREPTLVATLASVAASAAENEYVSRFANRHANATAEDYVNKVKALYDKRNECLHALGLSVTDGVTHLYKATKSGTRSLIDPLRLMEPCELLTAGPSTSLASAIEAIAIELHFSALGLAVLPSTVQWFRRRGTPRDLAPVLDRYVAVAVAPIDAAISTLRNEEEVLREKLDNQTASSSEMVEHEDEQ